MNNDMDPETTGHTTNNTEKKYEMNSGGVEDGWLDDSLRKMAPTPSVRPAASFRLWEKSQNIFGGTNLVFIFQSQ